MKNVKALRVFETVSRHSSVARAAEELGITPSAVSHQLKLVSEEYGYELLEKRGRGIILTEKGMEFARRLQDAFQAMRFAVASLDDSGRSTIRIAACSAFSKAVLSTIIFQKKIIQAGYRFDLQMYANDPQLTSVNAEIFVTAEDVPIGYWSRNLFRERLVAVCAPQTLATPKETENTFRICTDLDEASEGHWEKLDELEKNLLNKYPCVRVSHYVLAIEAALNSGGIALVPSFLAARYLQSGQLVKRFNKSIESEREYKICCRFSEKDALPVNLLLNSTRILIRKLDDIVCKC